MKEEMEKNYFPGPIPRVTVRVLHVPGAVQTLVPWGGGRGALRPALTLPPVTLAAINFLIPPIICLLSNFSTLESLFSQKKTPITHIKFS